jgi:hypothetical protein
MLTASVLIPLSIIESFTSEYFSSFIGSIIVSLSTNASFLISCSNLFYSDLLISVSKIFRLEHVNYGVGASS